MKFQICARNNLGNEDRSIDMHNNCKKILAFFAICEIYGVAVWAMTENACYKCKNILANNSSTYVENILVQAFIYNKS